MTHALGPSLRLVVRDVHHDVAELVVHTGADIVGKKIGESGLEERDVSVLILHRGATVISNPRNEEVVQAGDRLLCFGKLEEMRPMIAARRQHRARVKKLPSQPIHEDGRRG